MSTTNTNNIVWWFLQALLHLPHLITNIFVEFAKRIFLLVLHYKFICELILETVLLAARSAENPLQPKEIWRYKINKPINKMRNKNSKPYSLLKQLFDFDLNVLGSHGYTHVDKRTSFSSGTKDVPGITASTNSLDCQGLRVSAAQARSILPLSANPV